MSIKLALSGIIALASVTSLRAIEGNNPGNIQEGPFAHAHGSIGSLELKILVIVL
jgi:hypothetical protein